MGINRQKQISCVHYDLRMLISRASDKTGRMVMSCRHS